MNDHTVDIGSKFNKLTVLSLPVRGDRNYKCKCQCDCGTIKMVGKYCLLRGESKSCGCLSKKYNHPDNYDKGTYKLWHTMIRRCYNKKTNGFESYGKKGVRVCDRWLGVNGFVNFMVDMGDRPSTDYSIDRISCATGYGPDNCRWATVYEQANNRTTNRAITINGTTLNCAQWARIYGINTQTLTERLKAGWDDERAVTQPVRKRKKPNAKKQQNNI